MDDEHCYRVACSRDGRFDGAFVMAVTTTRIYCRPSCPAMAPKRSHARFFATPAAAQEAGFRACKRCRPDAAPGAPDWNTRADTVARAVRLIGDGVIEREGVSGLAGRLGYSPRQLHRLVVAELGTGPLRLALAHRIQTARTLLETTDLPVTDVAWASGFGSIRQFNDRIREVFAASPTELRAARTAGDRERDGATPGVMTARLTYRPPLDLPALLEFLGRRSVPGVESFDGVEYVRTLRLPRRGGLLSISLPDQDPRRAAVVCRFRLDDVRDYATAVARVRRLLDLDADPAAVSETLGAEPVMAALVRRRAGLRVPGAVDGSELAIRAVLGQQISVAGARTIAGRLVQRYGEPCPSDRAGVDRHFPTSAQLAAAAPGDLPMPAARARAVVALAGAVEDGVVDVGAGADRDRSEAELRRRPGIGPWTASYIRMRALGDPDVFLGTDLAVRKAMAAIGCTIDESRRWGPWRSYATLHLWSSLSPEPEGKRTEPS